MPNLSRADNSMLGRWWWGVDRWTLSAIGVLIGFGYIMMLAASPAVAERIGTSRETFIMKQVVFLAFAGAIVVLVSMLSPKDDSAAGHRRVCHRAGADRRDDGDRHGDQGRAALDFASGHVGPTERISEAVFCGDGGLADERGQEVAALPRNAARVRRSAD